MSLQKQVLRVVQVGFFLHQFLPGSAVGSELPTNVQKPQLQEQVCQCHYVTVILNKLMVNLLYQVVNPLISLLRLHRVLLTLWRQYQRDLLG